MNRVRVVGDTGVIATIQAFDTTTGKPKTGLLHSTTNLVMYIAKNTAALSSLGTLVTMTEGTWTSLGFKECANIPGTYQVGIPNAQIDTQGILLLTGRVTSDDSVYFRPEVIPVASSNVYAASLTAAEIHAALLDEFILWLQDGGFTRPATTGNATLKNSAGVGQTVAITTSPAAEPIITAT